MEEVVEDAAGGGLVIRRKSRQHVLGRPTFGGEMAAKPGDDLGKLVGQRLRMELGRHSEIVPGDRLDGAAGRCGQHPFSSTHGAHRVAMVLVHPDAPRHTGVKPMGSTLRGELHVFDAEDQRAAGHHICAHGPQQLMAEADAEHRYAPVTGLHQPRGLATKKRNVVVVLVEATNAGWTAQRHHGVVASQRRKRPGRPGLDDPERNAMASQVRADPHHVAIAPLAKHVDHGIPAFRGPLPGPGVCYPWRSTANRAKRKARNLSAAMDTAQGVRTRA